MRHSTVAVACAMVAGAVLLAPRSARATGGHHGSCSPGRWEVTVEAGPCPVSSPTSPACTDHGNWTGIKYKLGGASADHVATLVTDNCDVAVPPAIQVYAPCIGDPVTGLGRRSCHEQAVKVNPSHYTREFWVVVEGPKLPIDTSVAVKKGSCVQSYPVVGLGLDTSPFQATQKTEHVNFKGCVVKFVYDSLTGEVVSATLDEDLSSKPACGGDPPSPSCCSLQESNVSGLELFLDGQPLGNGQFGEGYVSSGTDSCTTRIIGGRVYSWGSPCP